MADLPDMMYCGECGGDIPVEPNGFNTGGKNDVLYWGRCACGAKTDVRKSATVKQRRGLK